MRRYIPINDVIEELGKELSFALPSIHALTGCDTVSSFYNIGKTKAFKAARKLSDEDLMLLSNLEKELSDEVIDVCTRFVTTLYDLPGKYSKFHRNINQFRVMLSTSKIITVENLPPSYPALLQHLKRCHWQTYVWYNAHKSIIEPLDLTTCGWRCEENVVIPVMFEGPSSLELLQKYFCNCSAKSTSCSQAESCTCFAQKIKCCPLCKCSSKCFSQPIQEENENCNSD